MRSMRHRRPGVRVAALVAIAVLVPACSDGDGSDGAAVESEQEEPSTDEVESDAEETRAAVSEEPPRPDLGLPSIELTTPATGGGPWPELAWEPVDGADRYSVTLYSPQGGAYWAWNGSETAVIVGGFEESPPSDASVEPRLQPDMTWDVVAHDADGELIAQSGVRPIGP